MIIGLYGILGEGKSARVVGWIFVSASPSGAAHLENKPALLSNILLYNLSLPYHLSFPCTITSQHFQQRSWNPLPQASHKYARLKSPEGHRPNGTFQTRDTWKHQAD